MVPVSISIGEQIRNMANVAERRIRLTSNSLDGTTRLAANLVAVGTEHPEALGAVDIGVGQRAGVLGLVDEAEVIGAGLVVLQGDSKQRLIELALDSVKEGLLRLGLDGVDGAESQTEQTIVVLVLHELLADLLGSLNGLTGGLDATNNDSVLVDFTAGRALVTVGDGPGSTRQFGAVAGLVDGMASLLGSRQLSREDPALTKISMHWYKLSTGISTYRSAEPVSKSRFRVVPPTLTGVRYSTSLSSGVVVAEPLSAAALTPVGIVAPYLWRALAYMPGKLILRVLVAGRTDWLTVNLLFPPIGTAEVTEAIPARTAVTLLKTTIVNGIKKRTMLCKE